MVKEKAHKIDSFVKRSEMIASEISTMVGIAINPLLGMVCVGGFEFYKAKTKSEPLSWYNSLWFLIPAALILLIIALKDTIGEALPPLKKFLDGFELVEHKVFAVLAFSSRVPSIVDSLNAPLSKYVSSILDNFGIATAYAATSGGLAGGVGDGVSNIISIVAVILIVLFCAVIFFVVWLTSGVVETLSFLSPIPFAGLLLKIVRLLLLFFFTVLSILSVFLGFIISMIIVLLCIKLAGWSFRLSVFGIVIFKDNITMKWKRFDVRGEKHIRVFSSKNIESVKNRSYGRFIKEGDKLVFLYKPFLVFKERSIFIDERPDNLKIAKGLLYPSVVIFDSISNSHTLLFHLRPMYRNHEENVAELIGIQKDVHQLWVVTKLRGIWRWIKDQISEEHLVKVENI
ncbi:MAG: hypothetical protein JW984_10955 [Deltaproteobacteria bacterium]|uniref:Uncharacterized protein n=1 Tax=Candidatus Zymogenus saltonus TaxID=2844893 RepID=A0A9D8KGE5_9DELT|nr:hypothetical protein [Candidatus Zymogenus saltonus]